MNRKYSIWTGIVIAAIVLTACGYYFSQEKHVPEFPAAREQVRIGFSREPVELLPVIAEEQGFFSEEGLDVIMTGYPSGRQAMEAMFNIRVDAAATDVTPIVFTSFEREDFRIVALIGSTENYHKIIARKDRGIQEPADLRGKRLATQEGSAMHFFLHLFLTKNALSEKDVLLSFMKVEELPTALAAGEVDAVTVREPLTGEAKKLLGDNAVVFDEPGLYHRTDFLVVSNHLINNNPEVIEKILRALLKAQDFANANPEQAVTIVSANLGMNESDTSEFWQELYMEVTLDQSSLIGLEDEARWAIKNNLTNNTKVPNYLNYIYADSLKAVKPQAVTIIH